MGRRKGSPATPGSWKPGQSANPRGRPREIDWVSDKTFCRMARERSARAMHFLTKVMESKSESTGHRIHAAEIIIERAHGKATQTHVLDSMSTNVSLSCTPADLIALAEQMALTEGDPIYPAPALASGSDE